MPIEVKVDLGIDTCISTVNEILSRRRNRKENLMSNLSEELVVISEIVKTLDNLFIDLARGFANNNITENPTLLQAHIDETYKYLTRRELLPLLEKHIGIISGAAVDPRLRGRNYREMVSVLISITGKVNVYREKLGRGGITGVGQMEEWNLQTLCERAQGSNYNVETVPIENIALGVLSNHNFDLSDSIHQLIGKACLHAKTAVL